MVEFHVAQVNIARLLAPLDSPVVGGFVEALEPINALADAAPGFVWRLQTEDGDATSVRVFDDDMLIVNLSVWESIADLAEFAYRSGHREVLVQKRKWFERMTEHHLALWWEQKGYLPSVDEASERLELLRVAGPTAEAFTFRDSFPPPQPPRSESALVQRVDDRWFCPTG